MEKKNFFVVIGTVMCSVVIGTQYCLQTTFVYFIDLESNVKVAFFHFNKWVLFISLALIEQIYFLLCLELCNFIMQLYFLTKFIFHISITKLINVNMFIILNIHIVKYHHILSTQAMFEWKYIRIRCKWSILDFIKVYKI